MARSTSKAMFMAAALALAVMGAGCTPRAPQVAPPPPPPPPPAAPASPDLMGGPPQAEQPPAPAPAPDVGMAPIANPEDMSPEEREQVYGHRYDYLDRWAAAPAHRRHRYVEWPAGGSYASESPRRHHQRHRHHERVDHERWGARPGAHHHGAAPGGAPAAHARGSHAQGSHAQGGHAPGDHAPGPHAQAPAASSTAASSSAAAAASASSAAAQSAASTAAPAAPQTSGVAPVEGFNLDWLGLPGTPFVDIPGIGKVASKYLVAVSLLIIAMALLAAAAFRNRRLHGPRRPAPSTVGSGPRFADEMPRKPPET